ncbi:MAG: ABC-F family ATP-binding cassette domain-containing protein, partial [Clostridia bacterium]|nr:ABC-F family ATP-binding cassette domain-containing protein [Clostridia bacterium]
TLVLDEPTNHLDIDSREALEKAIEEFDGTVIAVSHDRYFLGKLATRLLDLGDVAVDISVHKVGEGYEELLRDRQRRAQLTSAVIVEGATIGAPPTQKDIYLQNKKDASEARKLQNKIKRLSAEAERIEAELDAISKEMSGEAMYDYVRLSELDAKKNSLEERLLEIYEEIEI